MRRSWSIAALGLCLAWAPQAGAEIPLEVQIDTGRIVGAGGDSPDVHVYKGIPFAAPPVGELRWRGPAPVLPWTGVRDATEFGPRCMQGGFGGGALPDDVSEDCLYLNVWTTAGNADARLPVMVWIYGGGFTGGAGSEPRYSGENLARKGVVVVTLNYRLGAFGFLAHPELGAENDKGVSGNYGMRDALAALRWVQRNARAFGGDPSNVTVFGESAGANMVAALVGSPSAKGLFHRIIAQSGAWMGLGMAPMNTLAAALETGARAVGDLGAASIAEARGRSAADVLAGIRTAGLVVDGDLIPEDLSATFAGGRQLAVDVLAGSNRDEGTFFSFGGGQTVDSFSGRAQQRFGRLADEFLRLYPAGDDAQAQASYLASFSDEAAWHQRLLASRQAAIGRNAYVYYFTRVPPAAPGRPSRGATHVAEIAYMFDNLTGPAPWDDTDRALAATMSSYWVNFARNGDPNGPGLPVWPRYAGATGDVMMLGDEVRPEAERVPNAARLDFFDEAYREMLGD